MQKVAKFEKVSFEQFKEDWLKQQPAYTEETIQKIYKNIELPRRATTGSAGYDFFIPTDVAIEAGAEILIPTGIRVKIDPGYVLMLFPRSSLGFKYRLQLDNTVGIIDSDYYNAENEGHIMCKLINDSREEKMLEIKAQSGFVQGIFLPFAITDDDEVSEERIGGFGSTSK